jgi:uncharacterized protein (TIGR02246 family)
MTSYPADEAAICQTFAAAIDALNRGDAKAGAAHFVPDGDTVDSFGQVTKGRVNIEQRAPHYQGTKFTVQIESIRLVTPTVAILDATGDAMPAQGPPRKLRGVWVVVKHDGQWLFTAARTWVPATVPV